MEQQRWRVRDVAGEIREIDIILATKEEWDGSPESASMAWQGLAVRHVEVIAFRLAGTRHSDESQALGLRLERDVRPGIP